MINARFPAGNGGLSPHAGIRIQQRGIPRDMIQFLVRHGRQQQDHLGGIVVTFDGQSLERISRREPPELWRRASEERSLYAVIDGQGRVPFGFQGLQQPFAER